MSKTTALLVALGFAACDKGSASDPKPRSAAAPVQIDAAPKMCEPFTPPTAPVVVSGRNDVVKETRPVECVQVIVSPRSRFAWHLRIESRRKEMIRVLWDESTQVSPTGAAQGRLIRGETRRMDTAGTQPPSPIPPGTSINEWFLAEGLIELEDLYARLAGMPPGNDGPRPGGTLHLTLETANGKEVWEGAVTFETKE